MIRFAPFIFPLDLALLFLLLFRARFHGSIFVFLRVHAWIFWLQIGPAPYLLASCLSPAGQTWCVRCQLDIIGKWYMNCNIANGTIRCDGRRPVCQLPTADDPSFSAYNDGDLG